MWQAIGMILAVCKDALGLLEKSKESRDAAAKSRIGHDLFILYIQINELLILGDQIVEYLELFANVKFKDGKALYPTYRLYLDNGKMEEGMTLEDLVEAQLQNINLIIAALDHLSKSIDVVDGPFRRAITTQLNGKRMRLRLMNNEDGNFGAYVPTTLPFKKKYKKAAKKYLKEWEPKERLNEIETLASEFRSTLEKNFTVSDILVKVREKNSVMLTSMQHIDPYI